MSSDKTIGLWSTYQPEPARKVGWPDWETVNLIGRGSFGAVYEIQRDVFGNVEKAALKVISIPQNESDIEEMHSDGYDDESITVTFQNYLQSIVAEYSLMRKMNGCVNIVQCEDIRYVQRDNGFGWDIFIKMELLTPLTKAMTLQVPEQVVVKVAKDICNALIACKEYDIIHRDIKPQNIFVSKYGDYKLGDFGIAKTVEKTSGGTKIGTYKYMAPEVFNNQPYGSAADIYSLGLVLYWLLNERRMPFLPLPPAKINAGLEENARYRRFRGEQIPPPAHGSDALKRIVLKACAYDPKDRYPSAAAMLQDLNGSFVDPVILRKQEEEHRKAEEERRRQEETERINREKAAWEAKIRAEHEAKARAEREAAAKAAQERVERDRIRREREERDRTLLLDDDATVRIPQSQIPETKKKKTPIWVWIAGAAALVIVILLLCFSCGGKKEPETVPAPTPTSTLPPQPAAETAAVKKTEPDLDKLQKLLQEDHAAIGCYEVSYSSAAVKSGTVSFPVDASYNGLTVLVSDAEKTREAVVNNGIAKLEDMPAGSYILQLKTADSPDLEWSKWGSSLPEGVTMDTHKVQLNIMYRTSEKIYKESAKDTMEGWELYDTKPNAEPYGEWSKWGKKELKASDSLEVEHKHQFRSRTRQTTTSTSSQMDGWTKYDSKSTTNYGSWSDWSKKEITGSNTLEVEKKTTYSYDAYVYHDGKEYETIIYTSSNGKFQAGELAEDYVYSEGSWEGVRRQVFIAGPYFEKTVKYRSRSITTSTTYYFERWSEWSEWDEKSIDAASDREIQERDIYRSREILGDTLYCFWNWGDWSKWGLKKPVENETTKIEYKIAYRYAQ